MEILKFSENTELFSNALSLVVIAGVFFSALFLQRKAEKQIKNLLTSKT